MVSIFSVSFQLKSDLKFNFILIKILSRYVNFRAHQVAAIQSRDTRMEECNSVWHQINSLLSYDVNYVILLLLRTDVKRDNLHLCRLLYPLFSRVHYLIFQGHHKQLPMPEVLVFIITVLFYKHWTIMLTNVKDKVDHFKSWRICLEKHFVYMPKPMTNIYDGFIRRVDDRFNHASLYGKTAL